MISQEHTALAAACFQHVCCCFHVGTMVIPSTKERKMQYHGFVCFQQQSCVCLATPLHELWVSYGMWQRGKRRGMKQTPPVKAQSLEVWTCPTTPRSHFLQKEMGYNIRSWFLPSSNVKLTGLQVGFMKPSQDCSVPDGSSSCGETAILLLNCCQTSVRFDLNSSHQDYPINVQSRATGPRQLSAKQGSQTSELFPHQVPTQLISPEPRTV